ncbi:FAD-dependent urate hydroxylase [Microbotryomycetes sp. JL201]|nr:FAD-dependent urate hydroxylase [Microbotryomycetes sp. JL201]
MSAVLKVQLRTAGIPLYQHWQVHSESMLRALLIQPRRIQANATITTANASARQDSAVKTVQIHVMCGSLADGNDRYPREGDKCKCDEGWTGLNCNVCETDEACTELALRDPNTMMLPKGGGTNGDDKEADAAVCYKQGYAVREMHQMCDVTNRKILDMLPGRAPQVTFNCDTSSSTCGFQFWIGRNESFYCGLSNCTSSLEVGYDFNTTEYNCEKVSCACIPGKMLCGEDGSVDITEFLEEEVKGPGKFTQRSGEDSRFEEPAMNSLISDIFGDTYITINCKAGECLRASEVPGFVRPPKPNSKTWVVVTVAIAAAVLILGLFLFYYFGRSGTTDYSFGNGRIQLNGDDNETPHAAEEHVPTALQFSDLTYTLSNGRLVLDSVSGSVEPGQVMAVIGASGAGKSTFLDLLARKRKQGTVSGDILVNGNKVSDAEYRRVVGFVDQEDTLMSTLTVYETVLYSALLRLPRDMSYEDKKMRTLETMHELGILGIRDSRIGESGQRSISGGEKRRVSIACELVTSPSILFLDEPTSGAIGDGTEFRPVLTNEETGLDSYNAYNVVESLVALARNYKRTVVFTIHQPRSNIVALFDKLVLLANGKLVYSGEASACQQYFEKIGYACPPGFNIADYLIDLTMQNEKLPDAEDEQAHATGNGNSKRSSGSGSSTPVDVKLAKLVQSFASSDVAAENRERIAASSTSRSRGVANSQPIVLRSYKRASWWQQFTILSGRCFKNLYRNPMLMWSHYAVAIIVAVICAFLFRNLTDDIPGFQNRMGFGFFVLSLFGFSCLTTLNAFSSERLLFTRERANGYYSPVTYFAAKLLFDIVPLRVIPPFVFVAIVYAPIGLVPTVDSFWSFVLVLVMFNLTASSVVLFLSVIIKDLGIANLVGSLLMLFNLLFAGLLINREKLPWYLQWLETYSFFHAAFEAFLVNEVRYLQLIDHKYGIDIEVPAAAILSTFGFKLEFAFDVLLLLGCFVGFSLLSFVALHFFVKERR